MNVCANSPRAGSGGVARESRDDDGTRADAARLRCGDVAAGALFPRRLFVGSFCSRSVCGRKQLSRLQRLAGIIPSSRSELRADHLDLYWR